MRTRIYICLGVVLAVLVTWELGSQSIRVITERNVGIGTANPQGSLHVVPSIAGQNYFRVDDTNGAMRFEVGVKNAGLPAVWLPFGYTPNNTNYSFAAGADTLLINAPANTGANAIYFSLGEVPKWVIGVNSLAPVSGAALDLGTLLQPIRTNYSQTLAVGGGGSTAAKMFLYGMDGTTGSTIGSSDAGGLLLFNTNQMAINRINGRVGIGITNPAVSLHNKSSASANFRSGPGTPLGSATNIPALVANGAGVLNGTYLYAYTETDGNGESTLSPSNSIAAVNNTVRITIGLPRRGVSAQTLYRKNPASGSFKLVHVFGGGYFQNIWDDNVADATVDAAATAPSTDSSGIWNLEVNKGVKFVRSHPADDAAADLTVLTADATTDHYAIDSYGPILARSRNGNAFQSFITGTSDAASHFSGYRMGTIDDGGLITRVAVMYPDGNFHLTPFTMYDQGTTGKYAFSIISTNPVVNTIQHISTYLKTVGAGSSAVPQVGVYVDFVAGYTGSAATRAAEFRSGTASSGAALAALGQHSGASALGVGLAGSSGSATYNIGVFGGINDMVPNSLALTAGGVFSSGGINTNIVVLLSNTVPVTTFKSDGSIIHNGLLAINSAAMNATLNVQAPAAGLSGYFTDGVNSSLYVKHAAANGATMLALGNTGQTLQVGNSSFSPLVTFEHGGNAGFGTNAPVAGLEVFSFDADGVAKFGGPHGTILNVLTNIVQFQGAVNATATTTTNIHQQTGRVKLASGQQSYVVTNSLVTANSVVVATVNSDDANILSVKAIPAAGFLTLKGNNTAAADTDISFFITKP
jgi:hypothetical protein